MTSEKGAVVIAVLVAVLLTVTDGEVAAALLLRLATFTMGTLVNLTRISSRNSVFIGNCHVMSATVADRGLLPALTFGSTAVTAKMQNNVLMNVNKAVAWIIQSIYKHYYNDTCNLFRITHRKNAN